MHTLNLTSRGISLPHRQVPAGAVFARIEFATAEDAEFFRRRLGWTAFAVADGNSAPDTPPPPKVVAVVAPTPAQVAASSTPVAPPAAPPAGPVPPKPPAPPAATTPPKPPVAPPKPTNQPRR
jgi:hypothetical protein